MSELQEKATEFKENIIQKIIRKLFINEKKLYGDCKEIFN